MQLFLLRKLHGKFYEYKKKINLVKRPFGKKVYILGTPEYSNLGDSAIALAEKFFLEKCGIKSKRIKEITQSEVNIYADYIFGNIKSKYLICSIGGGNMGNLWYNEELFRYKFLDALSNNPTIIFPQTIYFTDDKNGEKAINDSLSHYNSHKNLSIVAREKYSYELLNKLYQAPKKLLVPDIVLSTNMQDYGVKETNRNGVLLVFRSDLEKSMLDKDREFIKEYLNSHSLNYNVTDMHSEIKIDKNNRLECVKNKMQEFVSSELIITDRLHGMVFAAITETPCIVFSNNHYKVKGTYEWIKYLPYIKYVENTDQAIKLIPELLSMKNCKFDNKPLSKYYDKLAEVVKRNVN